MSDEQRAREREARTIAEDAINIGPYDADAVLDAYASAVEARVRRELDAKVREMWGFNVAGAGDHISRNAVLRLLGETER